MQMIMGSCKANIIQIYNTFSVNQQTTFRRSFSLKLATATYLQCTVCNFIVSFLNVLFLNERVDLSNQPPKRFCVRPVKGDRQWSKFLRRKFLREVFYFFFFLRELFLQAGSPAISCARVSSRMREEDEIPDSLKRSSNGWKSSLIFLRMLKKPQKLKPAKLQCHTVISIRIYMPVYSPKSRIDVYCLRLIFNISIEIGLFRTASDRCGGISVRQTKSPEKFRFNCNENQRFLWRNITSDFR